MKTYTILFAIVFLMHLVTLVNLTLFSGEWNGIALWLSTGLFIVAVYYFGIEFRVRKRLEKEESGKGAG
ncbi:hypothetical protein [Alteribacter keqinensis]|uniref:Uncharacterized protein n=1 Tax=Alteribacter keqinensis TaxID=2483800 RepID=A0A3M7TRH9_9BACI|nr:hypothetical protein [Alteribacter keqinensis]RNA66970.1 hypothetical protein EBO34_17395 [Alteribacter keqinensis]